MTGRAARRRRHRRPRRGGLASATCWREIPATACGLPVETIVVDDGSTDRTAESPARPASTSHSLRASTRATASPCARATASRASRGARVHRHPRRRRPVEPGRDRRRAAAARRRRGGLRDRLARARRDGDRRPVPPGRRARVRAARAAAHRRAGDGHLAAASARCAPRSPQKVRQTQVQYQTSELLIGAIFAGYRDRRAADRHAQALRRRVQEGPQPPLRRCATRA